jgi:hypothetical protein
VKHLHDNLETVETARLGSLDFPTEPETKGGLFLNVVIGEGAAVFELLAGVGRLDLEVLILLQVNFAYETRPVVFNRDVFGGRRHDSDNIVGMLSDKVVEWTWCSRG